MLSVKLYHQTYNQTTVCIPARNEAATIGAVVALIQSAGKYAPGLLYEIIVVDDRSTDDTAAIARRAGARVLSTVKECVEFGGPTGKGDALWTALRYCETELVTFVDGDITELHPRFLEKLNKPLQIHPNMHLVKGRFSRGYGHSMSGRVTMLTARPLLALLHPELHHISEPLGGVFAGRTDTLRGLWLENDYGVDVGILLDVAAMYGPDSILEVNIGDLRHRNRDIIDLVSTAEQVTRTILSRSYPEVAKLNSNSSRSTSSQLGCTAVHSN